jgi:cobalt/nickel transport system permease protein
MIKKYRGLLILLIVLTILTPLAFILAEKFNFGEAWGEWGAEEIQKMTGYVPEGLENHEGLWSNAPMPDYSISLFKIPGSIGYFVSAVAGILLIIAVFSLGAKILQRGEK